MTAVTAACLGAAAACTPTPGAIDILIGNRSGHAVTVLVVSDDQEVKVWLRLPDATRTDIRNWPVRDQWAAAMVVDSDCRVVSPDPWGIIPVANGDPATGVEIDSNLQALSVIVDDLADLAREEQAVIDDPCPDIRLPPVK